MVSCEEPMQLSDDENPNEINDSGDKVVETIVIEDESLSQKSTLSENNSVIEINDSDYTTIKNYVLFERLDNVFKENKLLAEFIEKCLDLEHSEGMLRVINKNLLKAYNDADEKFKMSSEFKKVLIKNINLLETEPNYKFSHVKNLCDALKCLGSKKKRVEFVTLATNITNISRRGRLKRNRIITNRLAKNKRQKTDTVINLDFDQSDIPVINLDDQNDVIVLDEPIDLYEEKENRLVSKYSVQKNISEDNHNDVIVLDELVDVNMNRDVRKDNDDQENRFLESQVEVSWEPDANTCITAGPSKTLISFAELPISYEPEAPIEDDANLQEIKKIEDLIACHRDAILKLDETEVCDDTDTSPYIQSDNLKAEIVVLYKQLCELTGEEAVKRRSVRLDVLDGHPCGPVRRLEALINDKIGDDGQPHFPNFRDVVKCVIESNEVDDLGWTRARIMSEANALFTQCGRALQKKRQRRAYRDMLSFARSEPDSDPAERDPRLFAQLEENRRVALLRESELLERYATMQNDLSNVTRPSLRSVSTQNGSTQLECNSDGSDTDSDFESPRILSLNKNDSKSGNADTVLVSNFRAQDLKTNTQCFQGSKESRSTVQTDMSITTALDSSQDETTDSDIQHTVNSILHDQISRYLNERHRCQLKDSGDEVDANVQVDKSQHTECNFDVLNIKNHSEPKSQLNLHFHSEIKTEVAQNNAISNLKTQTNSSIEGIAKSIVADLQSQSVPSLQTHPNLDVKIEVCGDNDDSNLETQNNSVIEGIAKSVLRRDIDLNLDDLESKYETLVFTHSNSGIETLSVKDTTVSKLQTNIDCIQSPVKSTLEPRVDLNLATGSNGDTVVSQTHFDVQAQVGQKVSILQTQIELNAMSFENNTTGTVALKTEEQNISELQTHGKQCTTPNLQTQTEPNLQTQIEPNKGSLTQLDAMETDGLKIGTQTNAEVETQVTQQDNVTNLQSHIETNLQSQTVLKLPTEIDSKTESTKCNTKAVVLEIGTQNISEVQTQVAQDNDMSRLETQIGPNLHTQTELNVQTQIESNTESLQIKNVIETVVPEVKIKQEPVDIVALLEEFGDNFTCEIDIIDPFLVIEISSDSSDDEDM